MEPPKLESTTDYSIFELHGRHRPLHKDPVLLASMQRSGFWQSSPIHCVPCSGGHLDVVRGQHRLHYAQQLKLPVWYIVDECFRTIWDRREPITPQESDTANTQPKLESTTDYSRFEIQGDHRDFHESRTLLASMQKHGFWPSSAIHCMRASNGKLTVIRGRRRLHYARELGLPVWYIVDDTNTTFVERECCREGWSRRDLGRTTSRRARVSAGAQGTNGSHPKRRRATADDYLQRREAMYNAGSDRPRVPPAAEARQVRREDAKARRKEARKRAREAARFCRVTTLDQTADVTTPENDSHGGGGDKPVKNHLLLNWR